MVATATASYFLLTADYGAEPNALDPVSLHIFLYFQFFLGIFRWNWGRNGAFRNLFEVSDIGFP